MSNLTWFRRLYARDFSGSRVTSSFEKKNEAKINTAATNVRQDRTWYAPQKRYYHVTPICHHFKSDSIPLSLRSSYLYMSPGQMSEDYRSKVKFLTSKNHQLDPPNMHPAYPRSASAKREMPDDDISRSMASSEGSIRSSQSVTETISVTATRNETARQFIRPPDYKITELAGATKNRITCPKPNAMSPYAKCSDEMDQEGLTLKNHYTKVLCSSIKPFGVTFPQNPPKQNTAQPNIKSRRYDQYLGTASQSPVMSANAKTIRNTPQNRNLQSNSRGDTITVDSTTPANNYDYLKKANDNRYLEMCSASDDKVFISDPTALKKKHVEVVKMEVIRLDRKLRRSKEHTDIKRELEHVLQEALAQTKIYEQNVLHAKYCEDLEEEQNQDQPGHHRHLRNNFMAVKMNGGPRSSHAAVVLDQDNKSSQPKVAFVSQTRNRVRSRSKDGKLCYSVLKTEPASELEVEQEEQKSDEAELKANPKTEDVSMALTDLNGYDDGSEITTGCKSGTGTSVHKANKSVNMRMSKVEKDFKIAQRQHNQKVLDVFDIMKEVKTK